MDGLRDDDWCREPKHIHLDHILHFQSNLKGVFLLHLNFDLYRDCDGSLYRHGFFHSLRVKAVFGGRYIRLLAGQTLFKIVILGSYDKVNHYNSKGKNCNNWC